MTEALISAYLQLCGLYRERCSVDWILEDPELRNKFLAIVSHSGVNHPERDVLHGLTSLRKSGKLPPNPWKKRCR